VQKLLKNGSEADQKKMRNEIKSGLRKKSLTVLLDGMKSCEAIPILFRQKLQDFLDNVSEQIEDKSNKWKRPVIATKKKEVSLAEFMKRIIRAILRSEGNEDSEKNTKQPKAQTNNAKKCKKTQKI